MSCCRADPLRDSALLGDTQPSRSCAATGGARPWGGPNAPAPPPCPPPPTSGHTGNDKIALPPDVGPPVPPDALRAAEVAGDGTPGMRPSARRRLIFSWLAYAGGGGEKCAG
eukprot:58485-Chlamydomonas_euryale.AAC.1